MVSESIERLKLFLEELKSPFVGRDEEAKVIVLTLLAKEHCTFVGEPGCVVGNTLISDTDGSLYRIEDLALGLPTGVFSIDFPVLPPARATQLHIYDVTDVIRISTHLGFSLEVTPNHPIMTDRGWVEARDVKPGDKVVVISKLPSPSELVRIPAEKLLLSNNSLLDLRDLKYVIVDEYLGELIGILFTRGCFKDSYVELRFGNNEAHLIHHTEDLIRRSFGKEAVSMISRAIYKAEDGVKEVIRLNDEYLCSLLKFLVHDGRIRRRIPRLILRSPKNVSAAFLRSLFEIYGELHGGFEHSDVDNYLFLKGLEADLLREIQVLLLRHRVISRIRHINYSNGSKLNAESILEIYDLESLIKFYNEIGFISKYKNDRVKALIKLLYDSIDHKNHRHRSGSNVLLDSISNVEIVHGLFRVYDFYIPTTHAFFTNGLISHNTAKSALVRRAADLLDAKFFKYLLTRFTEPAEIFGPLDIRALHEGKYVRITHGKLPEADIVFLDEIFKANSAILNSLNTILQERVLYDGYNEIKVPLWSLFGASNEVPEEPETEAFYDRFAIRHFVKPVSEDLWYDLLSKSWDLEVRLSLNDGLSDERRIMSINDLRKLHQIVLNVDINPIKSKFVKLIAILEGRGIHVTDRRKGKALKIVAAHAMMNGRTTAIEDDLIAIKYVVPRDQEELDKVNTILSEELKTPYKYLRELNEVKGNVKEIYNYVSSLRNIESRFVEMRFREIYRDLEITKERVISLMLESSNKEVEKVANEVIQLIDNVMEMIRGKIT